jgi:endoglucanase
LPIGWLSTSGNQIVDDTNRPVRIAAINYPGLERYATLPSTSWNVPYRADLGAVRSYGFNCIRITLCDRNVIEDPLPARYLNVSVNPEFARKTVLQVLDLHIEHCSRIGLKVIIDSHVNAGTVKWDNQANGLWYDQGGAGDSTDGAGNKGTVTDQLFLKRWEAIARRYRGDPTVIGYDLRNEPHYGPATWGDGNLATDYCLMYRRIGDAIHAIEPNVLIFFAPLSDYRTEPYKQSDLTAILSHPVALKQPNKLVATVHQYANEVGGNLDGEPGAPNNSDGGMTAVGLYNAHWGFAYNQNLLPIFVGEMGGRSGTPDWYRYANTFVPYCNGLLSDGLVVQVDQYGPSTAWWVWGGPYGTTPDYGACNTWTRGSPPEPVQHGYWHQLLF